MLEFRTNLGRVLIQQRRRPAEFPWRLRHLKGPARDRQFAECGVLRCSPEATPAEVRVLVDFLHIEQGPAEDASFARRFPDFALGPFAQPDKEVAFELP